MNVFDYSVQDRKGEQVNLSEYKGKVLLIVNTATQCGFTPQYTELEKLYETYQGKGFEILDFPCNQFDGQAPEAIEEIHEICKLKYGTKFPQFGKVEVNGEDALPLYKYLTSKKGFAGFDMSHRIAPILDGKLREVDPEYEKDPSIKWNFTKFLVDRSGEVVARFEPTHDLGEVAASIEKLL
ncbi:MAG: glutathione peroxidase [Spirochaetaceae bacterium]|jgi:glutathione peroxidase|uniref:Glutathione peroxidase n=1 Tax=Sphaerochaeta halotolerans TaxID=2293840 RepID=A0A372MHW3_9SPIR|nr:glutathione peroxidase [Sphaerochaeta halotolerans]MBG0766801.1 glutathione peroxidase [Spirochaetaceae bacterium]RFU94988.1 glutathione peroxidase [Sphaerochaeta halotolerans]